VPGYVVFLKSTKGAVFKILQSTKINGKYVLWFGYKMAPQVHVLKTWSPAGVIRRGLSQIPVAHICNPSYS
jgi:hypothetical protein